MNRKIIWGIVIGIVVIASVFLILNIVDEDRGGVDEEEFFGEGEYFHEREENIFYVVTSPWKPYMYKEDGEYKGIAVELLDLVMNRLNIDYEFELIPWNRALKMAEAGEVEALLSASWNEKREPFIMYTSEQRAWGKEGIIPEHYLHFIEGVFLVRTEDKDDYVFESFDKLILDGTKIGTNQGYSYSPEISDMADSLNQVSHVSEQESFNALLNGEVDMFLTYKEVGLAIREELGLQDQVVIAKGPAPFVNYHFLLFAKNSDYPEIKEIQFRVDEELKKIHESGEFDEIYRKYVLEGMNENE